MRIWAVTDVYPICRAPTRVSSKLWTRHRGKPRGQGKSFVFHYIVGASLTIIDGHRAGAYELGDIFDEE
jgi:hypothetical protein